MQKYTVEILNFRKTGQDEEYLVRWEGNFAPTWELAAVIRKDCPAMVDKFHKFSQSFYVYVPINYCVVVAFRNPHLLEF